MIGTTIESLKQKSMNAKDLATNINSNIDNLSNVSVNHETGTNLIDHIDDYIHEQIDNKIKQKQSNNPKMSGGGLIHTGAKLTIEMVILVALFVLLSLNQTKKIVSKMCKLNLQSEITFGTIALYGLVLTILFLITRKIVFSIINFN